MLLILTGIPLIKDLGKMKYSEEPKISLVRPIFKKNKRNKIGNSMPLSILNGISKIYESCIKTYRKLEKTTRR